MSEEIPEPLRPLDPEEEVRIGKLSAADLQNVDAAIMANCRRQWRKVAMVVATAMRSVEERYPGLPDVFFAQRLLRLVDEGRVEAQGNLSFMRFSEVRVSLLESPR